MTGGQGMESQKYLSLDVSKSRIGVAVCDPLGLAAHPLTILERKSRNEDFLLLANLVMEEAPIAIICGLPLNMDNSEGPQARTMRKWAMRLAYALRFHCQRPIPIIFWDERLTTFTANQIMDEKGLTGNDDAIAAAVILQSFLDAQGKSDAQDWGRITLPPQNDDAELGKRSEGDIR